MAYRLLFFKSPPLCKMASFFRNIFYDFFLYELPIFYELYFLYFCLFVRFTFFQTRHRTNVRRGAAKVLLVSIAPATKPMVSLTREGSPHLSSLWRDSRRTGANSSTSTARTRTLTLAMQVCCRCC